MKFPTIFLNHGGGPLPLMGKQPHLAQHMSEVATKWLPRDNAPSAVVVVSAHWEADPIEITAAPTHHLLFDYYGFPKETYHYEYKAPGSPELARRIQKLMQDNGVESTLNTERGLDHGVFVPLKLMYPQANIPIIAVSLHASLSAKENMRIGKSLQSLRDDNILLLGSGYTFHNMKYLMNPTNESLDVSKKFNEWLKGAILKRDDDSAGTCTTNRLDVLADWKQQAPHATLAHPRTEHLLPLFVVAAAAGTGATASLIYDVPTPADGQHAVSGYKFD